MQRRLVATAVAALMLVLVPQATASAAEVDYVVDGETTGWAREPMSG